MSSTHQGKALWRGRELTLLFAGLFIVHAVLLFFDYGRLPAAPVLGDEFIINDPAITLSHGHGFRAESLVGSRVGLDKFYGHFPPVYQLLAAVVFRLFGVSIYTLRLTSSLADLACIACFFVGLAALIRWRLADRETVVPIAVVASVNVAFIALNRIARPESTVAFFGILGLWIVIAALYRDNANGLTLRRFGLLLLGSIATGLSLATHLEGVLMVALTGCAIAAAASASWLQKLAALAAIPATFAVVWCSTLGKNSVAGWQQMHAITYFDDALGPGWLREWNVLTANGTQFRISLQFLLMFGECLLLLLAIPLLALWLRRLRGDTTRTRLALALGAGCVLDICVMQFVLPGSPRRCGMMLTGLLFCLAITSPLPGALGRRLLNFGAAAFTIFCLVAFIGYFRTASNDNIRFNARRYDAIVDHVAATLPSGGRIVASPSLWLAFRERGVPVTVFYGPGFDGLSPFREFPRDSLDSFDTVVLVDTVLPDQEFLPEASHGRKLTVFPAGAEKIEVFQR
jgi:4-amino-4-deoxy-L-arabinose transferase-like glycosyltransferase